MCRIETHYIPTPHDSMYLCVIKNNNQKNKALVLYHSNMFSGVHLRLTQTIESECAHMEKGVCQRKCNAIFTVYITIVCTDHQQEIQISTYYSLFHKKLL